MAGTGARDQILVVDDDEAFSSYVTQVLDEAGFDSTRAGSAEAALASARTRRPDGVLLDVCLPGLSGYEACRALREEFGDGLPIIFLSGERTTPLDVSVGLLIGADDYVAKPFSADELVARLRAVVRRRRPTGTSVSVLTRRELEILQLLADGLPQTAIASGLVISPKTVGTHIEHILEKLGVHSRAAAVAAAYREGLLTAPPAPPVGV